MTPERELAQFLVRAKKTQYAYSPVLSPVNRNELRVLEAMEDGECSYCFANRQFEYRQTCWNGTTLRILEAVWDRSSNCPVWTLDLTGEILVAKQYQATVIAFLREALRRPPDRYPARGPATFRNRMFEYTHHSDGAVNMLTYRPLKGQFAWSGRESIHGMSQYLYKGEYSVKLSLRSASPAPADRNLVCV